MKIRYITWQLLNLFITVVYCVGLIYLCGQINAETPFSVYCFLIMLTILLIWFIITEIKIIKLQIIKNRIKKEIKILNKI